MSILPNRTPDQKAASRANGAKSRGPLTPQGKRNSAANSSRHGILARTVLLEGESRQRFNALMTSLYEELQPETAIETLLVQKMAVSQWRQMRLWGMEKASILHEVRRQQPSVSLEDPPTRDALGFRDQSRSAGLMNQYEMRYDHQFSRALDRFLRFREARSSAAKHKSEQTNLGND